MKYIVRSVEFLKDRVFKCETWRIEGAFVLVVLILLRYISGGFTLEHVQAFINHNISLSAFWHNQALLLWIADWIMVGGVLATFHYMSVARTMEEHQLAKEQSGEVSDVSCYHKLTTYFYWKEILFFVSFCLLQSWSAVLGGILFLLYPYWRKAWVRYHVK